MDRDSVDMNMSKVQETGEDRGAWPAAAHGVAKSRTQQWNNSSSMVGLQCCVSLRCTEKWSSYTDVQLHVFSHTFIHILFQILFHHSLLQDVGYNTREHEGGGPLVALSLSWR